MRPALWLMINLMIVDLIINTVLLSVTITHFFTGFTKWKCLHVVAGFTFCSSDKSKCFKICRVGLVYISLKLLLTQVLWNSICCSQTMDCCELETSSTVWTLTLFFFSVWWCCPQCAMNYRLVEAEKTKANHLLERFSEGKKNTVHQNHIFGCYCF